MKRVKNCFIALFVFCSMGISMQTIGQTDTSGQSLSVNSNETGAKKSAGEFEIVVSSYQNNGVKTIIVTRNKNGNFYDRTEWVGKGEVPIELKSLMGKTSLPAADVQAIVANSAQPGTVTPPGESQVAVSPNLEKSFFGVVIKDPKYDEPGVIVEEVVSKSPAFKIGIKKGDVITNLAGKRILNTNDFAKILTEKKPGEEVVCRFNHPGGRLSIERLALGEVPQGSGLNLNAVDGGSVFAPVPRQNRINTTAASGMPAATGGKKIISGANLSLNNFSAFITPNKNWLNVSFNGVSLPLSVLVFDTNGKEIFHQHLSWFQGSYKQLIKLTPGMTGPFQVIVAQGESVFSQKASGEQDASE